MSDDLTVEPTEDVSWSSWSEERPTKAGHYWWRLPEAVYGGLTLRPEWVCEVVSHGMGYAENELWPSMSDWDGYRRTVPAGLQWRGDGSAPKNAYVFPRFDLRACPFCDAIPTLGARDLSADGWVRLYTTAFQPNRFKIRCNRCGMANSFETPDLCALVDRWNARAGDGR